MTGRRNLIWLVYFFFFYLFILLEGKHQVYKIFQAKLLRTVMRENKVSEIKGRKINDGSEELSKKRKKNSILFVWKIVESK